MRKHAMTKNNNMMPVKCCICLLLALFAFLIPHLAQAAQASVIWDANPPEDNVIGYKLYFGEKTSCEGGASCEFNGNSSNKGVSPIDIPLSDLSDPNNPSYTLDGIDEGAWCLQLTAYNDIGESNPTSTISKVIDTVSPSISITSPTTSPIYSTTSSSIDISGTASDNICIESVTWTNDRGGSGTASGTTGWTQDGIALEEGDNMITVTANDSGGNTAYDSLTVTYTTLVELDTTPPTTAGHNPAKGAVDMPIDTNIVVHVKDSGDGVNQSTIIMTVEGAQVIPTITGTPADYTLTYNPPTDLDYSQVVNVTIDAADLAGNAMTQDAYSFITQAEPDITPPTGTILINNGASFTNSTSVTLTISATDGGGSGVVGWLVSKTQDTLPAADDPRWVGTTPTSYILSDGDGDKTIYAWFKDGAGNVSTESATDDILLDTTPPEGAISVTTE